MMQRQARSAAVGSGVTGTAGSGLGRPMRRRLPSVCCLSAIVALMLPPLLHQTAASAQDAGTHEPGVACVDSRATTMLTDKTISERHGARWRASVRRRGRCFSIQPGEHWERIYSSGGLVMMRKTPPEAGVPPLYFRVGSVHTAPYGPNKAGALPGTPVPKAMREPPPGVPPEPVQDPGSPATRIPLNALPSLPATFPQAAAPASAANSGVAMSDGVAVSAHTTAAASVRSVPVQDVRAQPNQDTGITTVPPILPPTLPPRSDGAEVSGRSYAVGFVIAIFLVTVVLAAFVLLMLVLLRRSPDRMMQPLQPDPVPTPMQPPMLREVPQGISGRVPPPTCEPASGPRPVQHWSAAMAAVPAVLRPVVLPSVAVWPPDDEGDSQLQCAVSLREIGWHASTRPVEGGQRHAVVVAQRGGRLMVLHCLPALTPVDEQAVEEACMAREREQADKAVIVSNAGYTAGAKQLAARIGVDLLHADELHAFAA